MRLDPPTGPSTDLHAMNMPARTGSRAIHDFDFFVGTWHSRQRRLKARLRGSDDWETFTATSRMQPLPGGIANFDTLVAEAWRPGWVGMSLRIFNPVTDLWSIYWVTNEGGGIDAGTGQVSAPVVGRFEGDEGCFEADDVFEGQPIRVRFRWQRQGANQARWEQAFSADGGQSWEVNWVMEFERMPDEGDAPRLSVPVEDIEAQVVELRRYALHPGRRDTLIDLFDREFVETQEALGLSVLGQFRDLDAPERFVWLRGFADMGSRARGLAAFYGGPVWQQHRDLANSTMVDSDNVLLLRPAWAGAGVFMRGRRRAAGAVRMGRAGLVDLSIFPLREPASPALLQFCRDVMAPCLRRAGAEVEAWYVTDSAPNNFPRLPVREGESVLVGVATFEDGASFEAFTRSAAWAREVEPGLSKWLLRPAETHRLVPTARSAIHARSA
jgi:hypothetical protein